MSTLEIEPGDAAEPFAIDPSLQRYAPFMLDPTLWPCTVAIVGGCQYTESDADWVCNKFEESVVHQNGRNQLHVACGPTPGAAAIVYKHRCEKRLPATLDLLRTNYGRAAEFRAAWDLLSAADRVVAFEPYDRLAGYALTLAKLIETRWGRGLPVVRVRSRR